MGGQTLETRARLRALAAAIAAVVGSIGFSGALYAQEPAEDESLSVSDEVTVTGTRIRQDDFSTPTPTTVVDSEYLDNLGIVNLGDAMVQMPQNVGSNAPTTGAGFFGPGGNFFSGSTLANLRGLNPFFGSRTLTLVDTRRHVPTNQGDGVDLNFVPTVLVDRMEVVTGGASASYGSGAIGGVTNILLDRDLEGIRAEVDYGETDAGDGADTHVAFAFGTSIGENGHFVVGIEDQQADPILWCTQARDWCAENYGTITNPNFPDGVNAQNVHAAGMRQSWNSHNGIFYIPRFDPDGPAGPLPARVPNTNTTVPLEVTASGTGLQSYATGLWGDGVINAQTTAVGGSANTATAIGGSGEGIYDDTQLKTEIDRLVGYFAFTYDISDRLGFFFDGSGGSADVFSPQYTQDANGFCMTADNAYLPTNTAAAALFAVPTNLNCRAGVPPTAPFNGILTKKNWEDQLNTHNLTTTDLVRYAFGFDGQFGESTWTWDAYYQYGQSERMQYVNEIRALIRYNLAFDSVIDNRPGSPTLGQPVCRSIRDNTLPPGYTTTEGQTLRNGCTPVNIFGVAPLSAAQKGYAFGYLREDTTVEQEIVEATASGEIAQIGGRAVQMAVGASVRTESIANIAAEELGNTLRTDFLIQYGDSFSGDVDVVEYFAEIDVPLFARFNVNVAGRKSEYEDTAGAGTGVEGQQFVYDIDTWKVSGAWDVVDPIRIRFSQSHDARAPNFRELYYRQLIHSGGVFGFCNNPWTSNPFDACNSDLRGGLELVPEESDTATIGIVITPVGGNLRFAIDYYEIDLNEAITPASTALVLEGCRTGDPVFCSQMSGITQPGYNPGNTIPCPATCFGDIDTIIAKAFNYRSYEFTGADFSADWIKTLTSGTFSLRFLASRAFHQRIQTSTTNTALIEDIAGVTGAPNSFLSDWSAAADLTSNVTATWSRNNFTITGQVRYIADGVNDRQLMGPDEPGYNITALPGPGVDQTVNVNTVPSYEIYNLSGSYDFELANGSMLQLFGNVNNLFDEDPPLIGGGRGFAAGGVGGAQPQFFDTLGRTYRVGLRMAF
jgi:outer membrane receptor protein involved in Fe transport